MLLFQRVTYLDESSSPHVIDGAGDERLVSIEKNALGNAGMDIEVYKQRLT